MLRGHVPHDGEAQAAPGDAPHGGVAPPVERLEDPRPLQRRDARTLILHDHGDFAAQGPRTDRNPPRGPPVLDRVLDQVPHGPAERLGIGQDRREVRGKALLHTDAILLERIPGIGERPLDDLRHLHRPHLVGPPPRLDTREIQDLSDHGREPPPLADHEGAVAPYLAWVLDHAVRQVLPRRADGGERSVELVGDARHELKLLAGEPLGPAGGGEEQGDRAAQKEDDRRAHRKVVEPDLRHRRLERPVAVPDDEPPRRLGRGRGRARLLTWPLGVEPVRTEAGGPPPPVQPVELAQLFERPQREQRLGDVAGPGVSLTRIGLVDHPVPLRVHHRYGRVQVPEVPLCEGRQEMLPQRLHVESDGEEVPGWRVKGITHDGEDEPGEG